MKFTNYNLRNMLGCNNYYFLDNIYEKKKFVTFKTNNIDIKSLLSQMFDLNGNDLINKDKLTLNDYYKLLNNKIIEYLKNKLDDKYIKLDMYIEIIYQNINFNSFFDMFFENDNDIMIFKFFTSKYNSLIKKIGKRNYEYLDTSNNYFSNYIKLDIKNEQTKYEDYLLDIYYYKFIYENSKYYNKYKNISYYVVSLDDNKENDYLKLVDVTKVINNSYMYFVDDIKNLVNKTKIEKINIEKNCSNTKCKFYNICKKTNDKQIEEKEIIDKDNLTVEFDKLKYPIYYLDFESFGSPYPRFKNEIPYSAHVFQYSLITRKSRDAELIYTDYLAPNNTDDFRYELFKKLTNEIDLTNDGTVMVFNDTFEKGRIKEAMKYFPDLKDKLENIYNHIVDLYKIVKGKQKDHPNYYNSKQNNSYSIKKLLTIFSNETYDNMNVKNGVEASDVYANFNNFSKEELEKERQNLITYCRQDTYSMYLIEKGLKEKIGYKK